MKVEGFEPSQRIGKKAFDAMGEATAEVWSTDCPLAALQFEQHAGVKPMHPMTILARATEKTALRSGFYRLQTKETHNEKVRTQRDSFQRRIFEAPRLDPNDTLAIKGRR